MIFNMLAACFLRKSQSSFLIFPLQQELSWVLFKVLSNICEEQSSPEYQSCLFSSDSQAVWHLWAASRKMMFVSMLVITFSVN